MKQVLFITNYASPYRVRFFDELGRYCQVTVAFSERIEEKKHRDKDWFTKGEGSFRWIQLEKRLGAVQGRALCADVIGLLKKPFDAIVICGYSSPTAVLAMAYLRLHRIPYFLEVDGGHIRQDSPMKLRLKRLLVKGAAGYFGTGNVAKAYLCHYGAEAEKVYDYPFTSLEAGDIWEEPASREEKETLRKELGISEEKVILFAGRPVYPKGLDVLMDAAARMPEGTGVYMVGGEPSQEILEKWEATKLPHVHFVGFRKKEELTKYYRASDVLAMPTRGDVWGLVVNEAMACGLPVVGSDRCVAARELIEDGVNGYVVPVEDAEALAEKLEKVLSGDGLAMGRACIRKIRPYTLENMALVHADLFERLGKG